MRDDRLWLYWLTDRCSAAGDNPLPRHFVKALADWFTGEIFVSPPSQAPPETALELTFVLGQLPVCEEWESRERVIRVRSTRITQFAAEWCGPDEWPFVAAIHENFDDLARRLVYADWLEERGDARAKLLREASQRLIDDGGLSVRPRPEGRWDIPSGAVSPEDRIWIWRRLVGIPESRP